MARRRHAGGVGRAAAAKARAARAAARCARKTGGARTVAARAADHARAAARHERHRADGALREDTGTGRGWGRVAPRAPAQERAARRARTSCVASPPPPNPNKDCARGEKGQAGEGRGDHREKCEAANAPAHPQRSWLRAHKQSNGGAGVHKSDTYHLARKSVTGRACAFNLSCQRKRLGCGTAVRRRRRRRGAAACAAQGAARHACALPRREPRPLAT